MAEGANGLTVKDPAAPNIRANGSANAYQPGPGHEHHEMLAIVLAYPR
jgi:hypothetical protein